MVKNRVFLIPVFLQRTCWFLLFIILLFFASRILFGQQDVAIEEKILQKLEIIINEQTKTKDLLNEILNNQEEIKKRLDIIKVRATVH